MFLPGNKKIWQDIHTGIYIDTHVGLQSELCTINIFELKSVSGGQRDQNVTSAEGVVHPVVSSVLSHLLAVTPGCVLCSDPLTQLTHSFLLRLPQPWPARKFNHSRDSELSIFNGPKGQRHLVTSKAGLRLGATSQQDHLSTWVTPV